jgi:hypothetical protein
MTSRTLATFSWPLQNASPALQQYFNQGLLLCHGFNHDEAFRTFEAALELAPQETMLHWAVAYSMSGNLNRPLTDPYRLQVAQQAVQKMMLLVIAGRRLTPEAAVPVKATVVRFPLLREIPRPHT